MVIKTIRFKQRKRNQVALTAARSAWRPIRSSPSGGAEPFWIPASSSNKPDRAPGDFPRNGAPFEQQPV